MNGSKAKSIRRAVYGSQSLRQPRQYVRLSNQRDEKTGNMVAGTIINRAGSLRAVYQSEKRSRS